MKHVIQFLGVCFFQCFHFCLFAQTYGYEYKFTVPVAPGATVTPVEFEQPGQVVVPMAYPIPPPIRPTPTPAPPIPEVIVRPVPVERVETFPRVNGRMRNGALEEPVPVPPIEERIPSYLPRDQMAPQRALEILDFWFGFLPNPAHVPKDQLAMWFSNSPEFDRQIRENFSQDVANAIRGDYNGWRDTAKGRLALILLLNQFPRHIYRNTPQAFAFDRMARAVVLEGMQKGDDRALLPFERAFFYLPLAHTEDRETQELSFFSYQRLLNESPMPTREQMQAFLNFAIQQKMQIERFGRFPHRNAILGRESTPEENIFLNQRMNSLF